MTTDTTSTENWYTGQTWRGVDYSPTWPTWVVGTGGTQTNDSDFANDAFQSLWGKAYQAAPAGDPSMPVSNSKYRDDLATISSFGFNLVRLYDWDMARGTAQGSDTGLDHINFLNYANSLGLKVVIPVSDYFLSDDQYAWNNQSLTDNSFSSAPSAIQTDFTQFINSITDPSTNKIHAAVHSISVGNEGDIGQGLTGTGNGGTTTTPSNFVARTIWWILNLHQSINGSSGVNGSSPVIPLSATVSNGDQGGSTGSWFQCFVNGVTAAQSTPNGCALGSTFASAVSGLSSCDSEYATYYYNSVNISQVSNVSPFSNTLAATLALYDSGAASWPGAKFNVPLLLMEVFTPNRNNFPSSADQATAAVGQAQSLETYLAANYAGTADSTTNLMGYNYFEFNDEQQVKLVGLYQYGTKSTNAKTGTTSLFYGTFPDYTFPVVDLVATPGPGGNGTLIGALQALFPKTITVQATSPWADTGINIQSGSTVAVTYLSGAWTADPKDNNDTLYTAAGSPDIVVSPGQPKYPMVNVNMGALIGRIGEGAPFLIGNGPVSVPDTTSGPLQLCINDDLTGTYGAGLSDNKGSVTVQITTA